MSLAITFRGQTTKLNKRFEFLLVRISFVSKRCYFHETKNTIESMFASINMFWARLRLVLVQAPRKGPKHFYVSEHNIFNIVITLEGNAKIKQCKK